jgi:hypothetical protein
VAIPPRDSDPQELVLAPKKYPIYGIIYCGNLWKYFLGSDSIIGDPNRARRWPYVLAMLAGQWDFANLVFDFHFSHPKPL